MLVSMNPLRLYEIIAGYAKEKNKSVLYIDMRTFLSLPEEKREVIKQWYLDEQIPQDEHAEIFANDMTFYEFNTETKATDVAMDWFPPSSYFEDQDYFIQVKVITPGGAISYTNKENPRPLT